MSASSERNLRALGLRLLFCLFAGGLLISTVSAYSDVQGHWNQAVIEKWSDSGVLSGYSDGTFRPDAPITRGQLASVLYRIWGCQPLKDGFIYPELPKDHWCYDALNTLNMYGVVLDHGGTLRPDEPLTREEAFYMIGRAFLMGRDRLSRRDALDGISDSADISEEYLQTIQWMMVDHYVSGSADKRLNPKRGVTRGEVMKVIDNIVDIYITEPGVCQVHAKQNVLVTCGGVTIQRTDVPAEHVDHRRTGYVRNYLFGDAAEGGVRFENHMSGGGTSTFHVYCVSEKTPSWQADSRCKIYSPGSYSFTAETYDFPDTRFSGGQGTEASPYRIASAEQFLLLAEALDGTEQANKSYLLTCDVDLGSLTAPLTASQEQEVRANLDGGGHTVTYRMQSGSLSDSSSGLFTSWVGDCSNITLNGAADVAFGKDLVRHVGTQTITAKEYAFGGWAGFFQGDTENCRTNMTISAACSELEQTNIQEYSLLVGGWAGSSRGSYRNCKASGAVNVVHFGQNAAVKVGGLAGSSLNFLQQTSKHYEVKGCSAEGTVSAQGGAHSTIGGLVGLFNGLHGQLGVPVEPDFCGMRDCWSTAQVSGKDASFQCDAGGLIGQLNSGTLERCWAKPTVLVDSGDSVFQNAGAITGACYDYGSISDCWANAAGVAAGGTRHSGGITGRLAGSVSNCFTLGSSSVETENAIAFVDWNSGSVTASTDMTGVSQKDRDEFLKSCGWNFTDIWDRSGAYPVLRNCGGAPQRTAQE